MNSYLLQGESDIQLMRDLIERLPQETTVVDFEETMLLATVRATTRLWQYQGKVVGFAFVDDYNIIRFEIEDEYRSAQLEGEIITWGITCVQKRRAETDEINGLGACFNSDNTWQIALLERFGHGSIAHVFIFTNFCVKCSGSRCRHLWKEAQLTMVYPAEIVKMV